MRSVFNTWYEFVTRCVMNSEYSKCILREHPYTNSATSLCSQQLNQKHHKFQVLFYYAITFENTIRNQF